jgi:hypothetical protein
MKTGCTQKRELFALWLCGGLSFSRNIESVLEPLRPSALAPLPSGKGEEPEKSNVLGNFVAQNIRFFGLSPSPIGGRPGQGQFPNGLKIILARVKPSLIWLMLVLMFMALSGCSVQPTMEQPALTGEVVLNANNPIGQTFVARYDGLSGIYFTLSPGEPGDGEIRLHLRADAQASEDLAVSYRSVPIASISGAMQQGFFIPAQINSNQTYYYAFLEITGSGSVEIGSGPGGSYLDGALYQNHTPQDAQAAFQLSYSRRAAAVGIAKEVVGWVGVVLVSLFLLVLPGWGLLSVLLPSWDTLRWPEKLSIAGGMNLAIYPLLLLWTDVFGLHLGVFYAWVPALLGGCLLAWRNRAKFQFFGRNPRTNIRNLQFSWPDLALVITLTLVIFSRFWAIRSLDAPLWGDSYQHTVIAQLLVDHGGLFSSWEPYAPYESLTVQYGFPNWAALFTWLTGMGILKAALTAGQIVNILAVLTLYPLATRFADGNRWAGVGALLIGGLFSPTPAVYTNWGRYAQLAGQAILPIALWMAWEALAQTERRWSAFKKPIIAAILLAGMLLAYYRMPFYYATFILALLIGWGLPSWRFNYKMWLSKIGILLVIGVSAGVLFLPWGLRLFGGALASAVEVGITGGSPLQGVITDYQAWRDIWLHAYPVAVVLALLGVVWSLLRKQWVVASLALWVVGLSSIVALGLVRLPGANMMQSFAVLIALYIPIGLAAGWLIGEAAHHSKKWKLEGIAALMVALAACWGFQLQLGMIQPNTYALVTRPDIRALAWINQHLPPKATFLVEGFLIYDGRSAVGGDAGWWIPLITGRGNTMPPQYALLNEKPTIPDYSQRVVEQVRDLAQTSITSTDGLEILCRAGITHVYVGQSQGWIGARAMQLFSPQEIAENSGFHLEYQQDRVRIFSLQPEACR